MKKCWFKTKPERWSIRQEEWKKARLVNKNLDTMTYTIQYKDHGKQIKSFPFDEIVFDKPEELKFKVDEVSKKGRLPKAFIALVWLTTYIWIVSSQVYTEWKDWQQMVITVGIWIIAMFGFGLANRYAEMHVNQEKILKILTEKE